MEPTTSRVRVATTFVVTLLVVLGEFLLLTSVYHLDDGAEREQDAHARFAGLLDVWRPGDPGRPLVRAGPTRWPPPVRPAPKPPATHPHRRRHRRPGHLRAAPAGRRPGGRAIEQDQARPTCGPR